MASAESVNTQESSTATKTGEFVPLTKLQRNCHSEATLQRPSMLSKIITKINNNQSDFQIFKPQGDCQLPHDEDEKDKLTAIELKYQLYEAMTRPLQGASMYSFETIKMKLEMDLMIREFLEESDAFDDL